eukprot:m.261129 g.261129  ORF g.261129 m.261129 type:complete len:279 (-) comp19222_c0_seq4:82-918(-)
MSEPMSVLFVSFFSPSSPPPFFFLFLFVLPALCRDDTTGTHVWAASLVFARWIVSLRQRLAGASVCELGAGCGVPGLVTGLCTDANEVLVTDLFAHTVDNLRHNVSLNLDLEGKVSVAAVDWARRHTWPGGPFEVLLGCDLVYDAQVVPLLVDVVMGLLAPGGTLFYVCGSGRQGTEELFAALQTKGLKCNLLEEAPQEYRENPLASGSDDDLHLHFNELDEITYMLAEFHRPADGVPVAEDDAARVARRRQIEEAVLQAQQQEEEEGQAKPQGLASS